MNHESLEDLGDSLWDDSPAEGLNSDTRLFVYAQQNKVLHGIPIGWALSSVGWGPRTQCWQFSSDASGAERRDAPADAMFVCAGEDCRRTMAGAQMNV